MTIFKTLIVSPFPVAKIVVVCLSKGILFAWIPYINFTVKGGENKTCRVLLLNLNSEYKGNVCIYVLRLCFLGVGVIHVLYPFLFRIDQFHFEIGW